MGRPQIKILSEKSISVDNIYFQYEPSTFIRSFYDGSEQDMLKISNSPHYKFIKLYITLKNDIWNIYKDTDYIKMQIAWGRDDNHNIDKVKRFISTYKSIVFEGLKNPIVVLKDPLHKKMFNNGYEIFHGHHRAAICCAINMKFIPCCIACKK